MASELSERQLLGQRHGELKKLRQTFEEDWRAITGQFLQYRGRWYQSDHNRGKSKAPTLINSTPQRAMRINNAGMMAGVTSPARIWFQLTVDDKTLKEKQSVREYLDKVARLIREALAQGRWYQALAASVYPDLSGIGTGANWMEANPEGGIRCEGLTPGEYWIDVDQNGIVDTIFRERTMSVRTLVQRWGLGAVSDNVRNSYKNNELARQVVVVHAVFPNSDWKDGALGPQGMKYASRWWERDTAHGQGFLAHGGYEEFPAQVPRWLVVSQECYGRGSPGWETVADAKALQHRENRMYRLVDKTADPPMVAVDSLRHKRVSLLSADVTYVPGGTAGAAGFRPAQEIPPQALTVLHQDIERHEDRIEKGFFVDLWLAILTDNRASPPTATEVTETRQEVMLQLGPLLTQLNNELLQPAVVRCYEVLARQGRLPAPPPELANAQGSVTVEFISIMHQVQKLTAIVGIRELISEIQALASIGMPEALDKVDSDAIVDELGEILGIRPDIIRSPEQVEEVRRAKAQQAEAAQTGEAMVRATEGMKNMSASDPQKVSEMAAMMAPGAAAAQWGGG